ncbi:MAG: hypothetical protein J5792_07695 [Bacteroidales bacterium]|nr:hypothetical protein [Bacteroidales bacterium]
MLLESSVMSQTVDTMLVRRSLLQQMQQYPQSTLRDIYKNFYQDRFGPAHLLEDTAAAAAYLREELRRCDTGLSPYYEPTAYDGNYVRVYLSCVLQGGLRTEQLTDALVRSSQLQVSYPFDWKSEWTVVLSVIEELGLELEDFAVDKAMIDALLEKGDLPVHHSRSYNAAYRPHYRIVARSIFERELLPELFAK